MTDSHEDGSRTLEDQPSVEVAGYCAACGAELPPNVWCPVRTETDPDGSVRVRTFCDETCRADWDGGGPGTVTDD